MSRRVAGGLLLLAVFAGPVAAGDWLRFSDPSGREVREFYEGSVPSDTSVTIGYQWGEGDPPMLFRAFLFHEVKPPVDGWAAPEEPGTERVPGVGEMSGHGRGEFSPKGRAAGGGGLPSAQGGVATGDVVSPSGAPAPAQGAEGANKRTKKKYGTMRELTALFHPPSATGGKRAGQSPGILWTNRSLNPGGKGYTEEVSLADVGMRRGENELLFEVTDSLSGERKAYRYVLDFVARPGMGPAPAPGGSDGPVIFTIEEYEKLTPEEFIQLRNERLRQQRERGQTAR